MWVDFCLHKIMILIWLMSASLSISIAITASQNEVSQYLNTEEMTSPKHKSQATSPNLPMNDLTINEEEVNIVTILARSDRKLNIRIAFPFQESITPTINEDTSPEDEAKKDDTISTSATATPPVQEIRYSNQYVNTANPTVAPTAVSVMSYAPPPPFAAPIEQGGTIYHTGVSVWSIFAYMKCAFSVDFIQFSLFFHPSQTEFDIANWYRLESSHYVTFRGEKKKARTTGMLRWREIRYSLLHCVFSYI